MKQITLWLPAEAPASIKHRVILLLQQGMLEGGLIVFSETLELSNPLAVIILVTTAAILFEIEKQKYINIPTTLSRHAMCTCPEDGVYCSSVTVTDHTHLTHLLSSISTTIDWIKELVQPLRYHRHRDHHGSRINPLLSTPNISTNINTFRKTTIARQ